MSRQDFAEQFGVTAETIQAWEKNGVTCRNQSFDYSIWRVLKLSRDVLETLYGAPSAPGTFDINE